MIVINNATLTIKSLQELVTNTRTLVNRRYVRIIIPARAKTPAPVPIIKEPNIWYISSEIPKKSVKAFGIRIPKICPKKAKMIPTWKVMAPIISFFFSSISLET